MQVATGYVFENTYFLDAAQGQLLDFRPVVENHADEFVARTPVFQSAYFDKEGIP